MAQQLTDLKVIEDFTITGNDSTTNDIAGIAEMQVKDYLKINSATFGLRASMTASSIAYQGNIGTALYRLTKRNKVSHSYDFEQGSTKKQRSGGKNALVYLNQETDATLLFESFDTQRYLDGGEKHISNALISVYDAALISNELIFMRGIIDYCLAKGQYSVLPMKTIANADEANDAYFKIADKVLELTDIIDDVSIGTNKEDFSFAVSRRAHLGLVKAHIKDSGTEKTHSVLATGELYQNKILGTYVQESFWLDRDIAKDDIDLDLAFQFSGVNALLVHNDAVANPFAYEYNKILEDNNTANKKLIYKAMGSLPVVLRPNLVHIFLEEEPTQARLDAAKAAVYDGQSFRYEKSFKLAEFDSL